MRGAWRSWSGIPFFVLNLEREFGARVIDAFADGYLAGATPNPCQACNQYIKFDELLRRGLAAYGADAVATGHYARVERDGGRFLLKRAADADKDQTYFLWVLDQEQLAHTRFPLGALTKPQVRCIAADLGLPTAAKPESQEICFVPAGDYRTLLQERRAYAGEPGAIIDADGARLGTHTGYAHYTVGQRHGLGLALGEPVYVREVRPSSNTVVIGRRDEVAASRFVVDGRRFVAGDPPAERFEASRADPPSRHRGELPGHARRRGWLPGRDRRPGLGAGPRAGGGALRRRRLPRRRPHRSSRMTPWLLLTVLVAATNLAALLVLRGRWGRIVLVLLPVSVDRHGGRRGDRGSGGAGGGSGRRFPPRRGLRRGAAGDGGGPALVERATVRGRGEDRG